MLGNLGGWHWIVILLIVLLLFGAPKLPALARSIGQSMRIFKQEVKPAAQADPYGDPVADRAPDASRPAESRSAESRPAESRSAESGDSAAKP